MIKNFLFKLDIEKEYNNRMHTVNSNDLQSVKFTFIITDNGIPLDLTGLTVRIAIRKPDKKAVWQDCTITNAPRGEAEVILDNQAYVKKGEHEAEVMLYKGTNTVAITQKFYYRASLGIMSDNSLKSETVLGPIDLKLAEVEETLEDLRKNGTGIDAQARQGIEDVTAALQEKATKQELGEPKYHYSETPYYNPTRSVGSLLDRMTLLDFEQFLLMNNYGGQDFYLASPNTLTPTKLFTGTQTTPSWAAGKLFPMYGTYDVVLAWSRNANIVWRMTTNGVEQLSFPNQKWGWLPNTGIDWKPSEAGYLTNQSTIIYAEYVVPSFGAKYNETQAINVWRSGDGGKTWNIVFTKNTRNHANPEVFHFHVIRRDPYNPSHWYLSSGDLPEESFMWRSTDDGLTWEEVNDLSFAGEKQKIHRNTNLYFTPTHIYWGTDDIINSNSLGASWVKAERNIGGRLKITPLYNLRNPVRSIYQTPLGLIVMTEKTGGEPNKGLIWMVPYDNLDKPTLIAKVPGAAFNMQLSDYSFGTRIFLGDFHSHSTPLYGKNVTPSMSMIDIGRIN